MERETKEITTPIGNNKVVLKAWLTGRERREIRSVLLDNVNFSAGSKGADQEGDLQPDYEIKGSILEEAQNKAMETVVISIDGVAENIVDTLLDMRDTDFEFVSEEINKITGDTDEESKKK